jgi:hypothetical protein
MLMTGDPITAQEAHRLGMVNQIHPADELLPAAHRIAAKIACNSPTAVQAVKRAVQSRSRTCGCGPGSPTRRPEPPSRPARTRSAWSGAGAITEVGLSFTGESEWIPAVVEPPQGPYQWQDWHH